MTYDDERVVALLKDSVPAVPDAPARVDAVRRLAARQRSFVQVQVLGAAASVVLLLAAVAALAKPAGSQEVRIAKDPARTVAAALDAARSARLEITARITFRGLGAPRDSVVTGAMTAEGDLRLDGAQQMVMVDGVFYRRAFPVEKLPPGKRWVSTNEGASPLGVGMAIRRLPDALRDVRFVRHGEVRGVPVAEYEGVLDPATIGVEGTPVRTTFALDKEGRPRRITGSIDVPGTTTEFTIELFGFGEHVEITAPPASEVVPQSEVRVPTIDDFVKKGLTDCLAVADTPMDSRNCVSAYDQSLDDVECETTFVAGETRYTCTDGTAGKDTY